MQLTHVFSYIPGGGATSAQVALQTELDQEVATFRAATYAENTKKSYSTHMKCYFQFCDLVGRPPAPATPTHVAQYAAYLARRLKPSSVRQYLNIIRILHLDANLTNPMQDNWLVKTTLTGIDRVLGDPVKRRTPVTPDLLLKLRSLLDLKRF